MRELLAIFIVIAVAWRAQAAVSCKSAGRFADTSDTTCQNYTLCVYNSTSGSYLAYNYVCPTTSVFNPTTSQCTASDNYVCNNTITDSNNTSSVCTADGYVANPNSTNCTEYIECVEIDESYTETNYTCPDDTYFNPNTTLCESDYNCTATDSFTCTAAGRFADTSESGCQNYFLCVLTSSNAYVQYSYTCPTSSVFNPNTAVCTTSYTCTT